MPSPSIKARLGALERRAAQRRGKAPAYDSREYWEAEALAWGSRPPRSPEQAASERATLIPYAAMIERMRASLEASPEEPAAEGGRTALEDFEHGLAEGESYVRRTLEDREAARQRLIDRGQWPH